jgi:hypothetical protein
VLFAPDSNTLGFFGEIHVLHQFNCIGLFGANRACLHLETPKLKEVYLSKINSILKEK